MPAAPVAYCACGCGTSLQGRRPGTLYASDACKSRAWRTRTGYKLHAQRQPCQTRQNTRARSGLQISFRKAVNALVDHLEWEMPTRQATSKAHEILEPALPDAQRARLRARAHDPARTSVA